MKLYEKAQQFRVSASCPKGTEQIEKYLFKKFTKYQQKQWRSVEFKSQTAPPKSTIYTLYALHSEQVLPSLISLFLQFSVKVSP